MGYVMKLTLAVLVHYVLAGWVTNLRFNLSPSFLWIGEGIGFIELLKDQRPR